MRGSAVGWWHTLDGDQPWPVDVREGEKDPQVARINVDANVVDVRLNAVPPEDRNDCLRCDPLEAQIGRQRLIDLIRIEARAGPAEMAAQQLSVRAKARDLPRTQVQPWRVARAYARSGGCTLHVSQMEAKLHVCAAGSNEAAFLQRDESTVLETLREPVEARRRTLHLEPRARIEARGHACEVAPYVGRARFRGAGREADPDFPRAVVSK